MQLRNRTIPTEHASTPKAPTIATTATAPKARRGARARRPPPPRDSDEEARDDILPLSQNGVRHAIRYADWLLETNNVSLHDHFVADGRRLYRRWQDCDITTRSGANSKLIRQREFDAFVRFVQAETGVDITEDVK